MYASSENTWLGTVEQRRLQRVPINMIVWEHLEAPRCGGSSDEYPQCMLKAKIRGLKLETVGGSNE